MANRNNSNKIIPLEALRGIAAFMVFLFHFILGFAPQRHGHEIQNAIIGGNLKETPLFALINGNAAVTFFFVLSGFVLSYGYFKKTSNYGLLGSVLKRLPRLIPLALISVIISWALLNFELYQFHQTANITKSNWMSSFAHAKPGYFDMSLLDAFIQGSFKTFFFGDANLNTSLWTMKYEWYGSLIVFGLIFLCNIVARKYALIILLLAFIMTFKHNLYYCCFVLGCLLSYLHCKYHLKDSRLFENKKLFYLQLVFIIIAFGYIEPGLGFYRIMAPLESVTFRILLHTTASLLIINLVVSSNVVHDYLDTKFGAFLGRCSFSLYVMHVPVLFVFSTFVFLQTHEKFGYEIAVLLSFTLTIPVLFATSWLLSIVDSAWCKKINRFVKKCYSN